MFVLNYCLLAEISLASLSPINEGLVEEGNSVRGQTDSDSDFDERKEREREIVKEISNEEDDFDEEIDEEEREGEGEGGDLMCVICKKAISSPAAARCGHVGCFECWKDLETMESENKVEKVGDKIDTKRSEKGKGRGGTCTCPSCGELIYIHQVSRLYF